MKNMSFSITTPQMYAEEKTVTRRWGWYNVKAGERLRAVEKCMGLKKGEKLKVIYEIEVISAEEEPLSNLTRDLEPAFFIYARGEMRREGFPGREPEDFVSMLRSIKPKKLAKEHPMRIEFKKVDQQQTGEK